MDLLSIFVTLWILLILIFAFLNFRLAVSLYLANIILVPFLEISIGGIQFGNNLINLVLLIGFIIFTKNNKIKIDYRIMKPFLVLMLSLFLMIFFQKDTPLNFQLNVWRADFMSGLILPVIIYNMVAFDKKSLKYISFALLISISISSIYGLILTKLSGINPYLLLFTASKQNIDKIEFGDSESFGRLFGYIQSTFNSPMTYGLFLLFSSVLVIVLTTKKNRYLLIIIELTILLNIIFAGVRSTILAGMIGIGYYLIYIRKIKYLVIATIVFTSLYYVVDNNKILSEYFTINSLSEKSSNLEGSTIEMRTEQLNGVFSEIKNCFSQGKGYGWTGYYIQNKGFHPVCIAFESLLMVILANSGMIGVFLWIFFIIYTFYMNRKIIVKKQKYVFLDIILILYLSFSFLTGEYGYMKFYMIFYTFIAAIYLRERKKGVYEK